MLAGDHITFDIGELKMDATVRSLLSMARPPLVLHLHGGAFGAGRGECDDCVAQLLVETGAVVVSLDYPSGPATPFPIALEAAFAVLLDLARDRARFAKRLSPLFVAGVEAGGNLAAALAMLSRDRQGPKLAGQILVSPMLDSGMATGSIRAAHAGLVGCKWADGWRDYLGAPQTASHPYANPAASLRLSGLVPALVLTAEDDPMRDESLSYAARLGTSGVCVTTRLLPAPTRWPDALERPEAGESACSQAARAAILQFLCDPKTAF